MSNFYKIRETNYPLYYFDLAKMMIIKKDLKREELTGKKETTTFMGCAKQWIEIMIC